MLRTLPEAGTPAALNHEIEGFLQNMAGVLIICMCGTTV